MQYLWTQKKFLVENGEITCLDEVVQPPGNDLILTLSRYEILKDARLIFPKIFHHLNFTEFYLNGNFRNFSQKFVITTFVEIIF